MLFTYIYILLLCKLCYDGTHCLLYALRDDSTPHCIGQALPIKA